MIRLENSKEVLRVDIQGTKNENMTEFFEIFMEIKEMVDKQKREGDYEYFAKIFMQGVALMVDREVAVDILDKTYTTKDRAGKIAEKMSKDFGSGLKELLKEITDIVKNSIKEDTEKKGGNNE